MANARGRLRRTIFAVRGQLPIASQERPELDRVDPMDSMDPVDSMGIRTAGTPAHKKADRS